MNKDKAKQEAAQTVLQRVEAIRDTYAALVKLLTDASYNTDGTLPPDHPIRVLHENARDYYVGLQFATPTAQQQAAMAQNFSNAVGVLQAQGTLGAFSNDDLKLLVKGIGAICLDPNAAGAGPYIEMATNLAY